MNRNPNTGVVVALSVIGAVLVVLVFTGVAAILTHSISSSRKDSAAHDTSSPLLPSSVTTTASPTTTDDTTEPDYSTPTTTETTTTETILYGGIAYSGSGAYQTRYNYPDGQQAKTEAVNACNSSIWSKGWSSDSYCGYVSLQTGQCGSVATAPAASGWGPTGWASGANPRETVRQAAIDKCNSLGQGVCHELVTLCM